MPNFTGQRKIRWYQVNATAGAIAGFLRYGRWNKPTWSVAKAIRIARELTGEQIADDDLKAALQACDRYTQRELLRERMGDVA